MRPRALSILETLSTVVNVLLKDVGSHCHERHRMKSSKKTDGVTSSSSAGKVTCSCLLTLDRRLLKRSEALFLYSEEYTSIIQRNLKNNSTLDAVLSTGCSSRQRYNKIQRQVFLFVFSNNFSLRNFVKSISAVFSSKSRIFVPSERIERHDVVRAVYAHHSGL